MNFDPELMKENVEELIEIVRTNGSFSSETAALEAILEKMNSCAALDEVPSDTWPGRAAKTPIDFEQIKAFVQACFSLAIFIPKKYVVGLLKSSGLVSKYNLENQLSQLEIPCHTESSIWLNTYLKNYAFKLDEQNGSFANSSLRNLQYLLEQPMLHPLEAPSKSVSLRSLLQKKSWRAAIVTTQEPEKINLEDLLAYSLLKEGESNSVPVPIKGKELDQYDTLVQLIAVSVQDYLPLPPKELHRFSFDLGNRLAAGSAIGFLGAWNGNLEALINRKILNSWKRVIFFSHIQLDIRLHETIQVYNMDQLITI